MAQDIDVERLWPTLGELRAAADHAKTQRAELIAKVERLTEAQARQRVDHDKLVNRGLGLLIGVGAVAGTAGAAMSTITVTEILP